ncbi:MAG: SurA N-terminal domain-containing protein [Desulfobacterales bacterium]|nr:SurA N-terminal domain-containing protein [Desulfobacterales bacterium]MDD4392977.1 SurA N-terminal domain-containing protein [Desulfobacterales bacterium]
MLNLMRSKANTWVIKFLLGAIVIVFVFWGVGSFRSKRGARVATVNGETITIEEYRESYDSLIEQLRQRFGSSLNDDMINLLQVKHQALDRLIDQRLLLQEADELSFKVSDSELAETIRSMSAFHANGVFDQGLYKNILSRYQMTPEQFENFQRKSMLIEKVRTLIVDSVKVSDQEAMAWYNWENASANIDFVMFDPSRYQDIAHSDEAIRLYYDQHKETYKTDPMVKVQYLRFEPEAYKSEIQLTSEEIEEYYNSNLSEFETPATVEARHILLKVNENDSDEAVAKAKQKAMDIFKMSREGKDFAALAKQYSEGPAKKDGGYLGIFKRQDMVKPFSDKAFSMKPGEISEPVRTRFGWHLIKVEKVNEASTMSLKEAEEKIRGILTEDKTRTLAYDSAEAVYDAFIEGDNLADIAKSRQLEIHTTDFFSGKDSVNGISKSSEFVAVAFNLSAMEISDIQDLGDGYYLIQVIEKESEKIPGLDTVKDRVMSDFISDKQGEKAAEDSNRFFSALKSGKSMEEEVKSYGVTVSYTGWFKRNASIPEIGYESEIAEASFKLSADNPLPERVFKGAKGYYVIRFGERKTPDAQAFEKARSEVTDRLLKQKQFKTFDTWLAGIKEKSDIALLNEDLIK